MSSKSTRVICDSPDSFAPLKCSPDERPPLFVTPMGEGYLAEELDTAKFDWLQAVFKIPGPTRRGRKAAIAKADKLRERYEKLLGHRAGHPDQPLPVDALPHVEIKKA